MTTSPEPAAEATATIPVGDLLTLLDAALIFAAPRSDEITPAVYATVRLEAGGGTATATATTRYTAGHARRPAAGTLPPLLLSRSATEAVSAAFATLRTERGPATLVSITIRPAGAATPLITFAGPTVTVSTHTEPYEFPVGALEVMYNRTLAGGSTAADQVAVDMAWLDAVSAVTKLVDDEMRVVRIRAGGRADPIRVDVGNWFAAIIMPTRLRHGSEDEAAVPFGLNTPAGA